jgi:hypothetical protein
MLDDALPALDAQLDSEIEPPDPERGHEVLRAYVALRERMAGELVFQIATGEGARVEDLLRFYACAGTEPGVEGVEALLATLGTLEDATALKGVSATTGTHVLLVVLDTEGRYLAHVLQPLMRVQ